MVTNGKFYKVVILLGVMMKRINLKERLNNVIWKSGSEMGPALNNLILYGPFRRGFVSDANLDILEKNNCSFEDFYEKNIFPKVGRMFNSFAEGIYRIPNDKNELNCLFEYRTAEEIRERFRVSYGVQQFKLDDVTRDGLFVDDNLYRHGDNVLHCFNDESGHMLSSRYKSDQEMLAKYAAIYSKLTGVEKRKFLGFVVDVAESNAGSWKDYSYYEEKHGARSMEMLLGDIFGVKIVDLNQERAKRKIKKLANMGGDISFDNFSSIKEKFKDNRWKTAKLRPGGIHYTIVDAEFPNYPVEVMFRGIRDEFYNLYGPNRHDVYANSGKRANPKFCDKK